jgi:hypothetical protein
MTDNYDTETMRAIIAEAKRQGFDDKIIALNLGIARDNPAFGYEGEDQLRASISEHLRRGIHREGIADRLSLSLPELVRIEGNPDLRIGMYGDLWCAYPDSAHSEKSILRLIELGRASFRRTNGNAVLRQVSRNESLVLLVEELGFEGARKLIARFVHVCGGNDAAANGLHIPKVAAFAVMVGSFPASDVEPLAGNETVH